MKITARTRANVTGILAATIAISGAVAASLAAADANASAAPDQVLVLYNRDWTEDLDGSAPGQDSEEVARYYVERHTDPATGKKPFLLGLACVHGKRHLDEFRMQEEKGDNERGVIFKGKGQLTGDFIIPSIQPAYSRAGAQAVDRDTVPIQYWGEPRKQIDVKQVRIRMGPAERFEDNPVVYEHGKCLKPALSGAEGGDWVTEKDGGWTIKVAAFDGGKSKLWFKGCNEKGEAVMILAAEYRELPAGPADAPKAPNAPKAIFVTANVVYPRMVISKEEAENPDAASITVKMGSADDEAAAKEVFPAKPEEGKEPLVLVGAGGRDFLLRPDAFSKGTVYAWLSGKDASGKAFTKKATFYDVKDFEGSKLGPDGVADDRFYQEDVVLPLKKFLEDPANKTAEGSLLKDHILYVVICYGLPLQVKSACGIRRGTLSGTVGDAGTGAALEQRLEMLYYDDSKYVTPMVIAQNPGTGPAVPTVATPVRASLAGGTIRGGPDPYRHPWALEDVPSRPNIIPKEAEQPHFTEDLRRQMGDRFIYLVMRVDNYHPELAKAEVDGAIYATKYLTPKINGASKWSKYQQGTRGARELEELGFDTKPPAMDDPRRLLFFFGVFGYGTRHVEQEYVKDKNARQPCFGEKPFLPGGLGYAVRSGEAWKGRVRSEFGYYQDKALEAGVSIGGGDALGAHITSHSWWDDQVMFHHLFRGWDAAECIYMSTIYIGWITYYAGDPLYCPDLSKTTPDAKAPELKGGAAFDVKFGEGKSGAWARIGCELAQKPDAPEMAEIAVEYWKDTEPAKKRTAAAWRYLARPCAYIGGLEPGKKYACRVLLTDPYGNVFDSDKAMPGKCVITVPANLAAVKPVGEVTFDADVKSSCEKADKLLDQADPEHGEIHLVYTVEKESDAAQELLRGSRNFRFLGNSPKGLTFEAGGAPVESYTVLYNREKPDEWKTEAFQTMAGDEYHVVLRWSREPLMREIVLVAKDGREFLLGANNFIPWRPVGPAPAGPSGIRLSALDKTGVKFTKVTLYNRVDPPPVEHSAVIPRMFDGTAFDKANGK